MYGSSVTCPVVHLCSTGRTGSLKVKALISVRRPGPTTGARVGQGQKLKYENPFFYFFLFSSILELLVFSGQSSSLFQSFHLFILYSISEWPEKPITSSKVGFLNHITRWSRWVTQFLRKMLHHASPGIEIIS